MNDYDDELPPHNPLSILVLILMWAFLIYSFL